MKIYHALIPNDKDLIFEEKNMMTMTLPNDLYIRENVEKFENNEKIMCFDLQILVKKNQYFLQLQIIENDLLML